MSITTALNHVTQYHYDRPVSLGMQTIRLRPAPHTRTHISSYSLRITPKNHFMNWQQDPFGNYLARIVFPEKLSEFRIEVDLLAEIKAFNPFDFFLEDSAQRFPLVYEALLRDELLPYLEIKEQNPALQAWLEGVDRTERNIIDFLVAINQRLHHTLGYTVRLEPGIQSCEDTLKLGTGSCRDMAWFLCQALRHLGFGTRFVSGYLVQLAQDVTVSSPPSGLSTDFIDLHAWTEVYLPGAGWVGLDPTSGLFAGEGHIPLCCTPNPSSAAPVTGTLEGGTRVQFHHDMSITRVQEGSRVTKPYTDAQWRDIDELGKRVEVKLKEGDVRLTIGGEPTFVSLDDRNGTEWHYAALSETKKTLGKNLLHRLRHRFAPGGLVMCVQGKWYPGEILPRWAFPCIWRQDGIPIWHNDRLFADPDSSLGHTIDTAKGFIEAVGVSLGIPPSYVLPVHEDTTYYLWKEHRLPHEYDILTADIFERCERLRLQHLMDQHLNTPVGYVLPLHFSHRRHRWISNRWQFRGPHVVLLTGDSPLGLRLPIRGLPNPRESEEEVVMERSLFEPVEDLPTPDDLRKTLRLHEQPDDSVFRSDPNGLIKTALCVEVRGGVLHVFLPPVVYAEHFLELLTAIEHISASTSIPIVLEGYPPSRDRRLLHFSVTPDPGVIEVNIHPARDWEEHKNIIQTVYDEAELGRLSAEKFMLDGRRVGTGGGNHIVLGAATPEDSPFLRRPDLLESMIRFWQNHPSLSYLFSSLYIGPTSQAPRIDEARHDSLYELDIAFQQIPDSSTVPPWFVDRLFRNLLVDLSGNTHRAEFCIDKLYSPDHDRGRLGLLEMRGFEMPPHPQMNLLQTLLLRCCIAWFWETPYRAKFVRWGTQLHDTFMLPHYLAEDFRHVLDELRASGFDFKQEWFTPFFAFRFPICGSVQVDGVTLALRSALEPWPVMGEESAAGGVSRAVDATVERLEVSAIGLKPSHHMVTCNGRMVPLAATNVTNTYVAGVRFKAWAQPSSLHPQLPTQTPLVFDLIDTRHGRSLGGCTYHVSHPGGRSYERFPVNENEAEGRRLARFESIGHTPGKISIPSHEFNEAFPHTLDLRRRP